MTIESFLATKTTRAAIFFLAPLLSALVVGILLHDVEEYVKRGLVLGVLFAILVLLFNAFPN